jgi:hypothetical protein
VAVVNAKPVYVTAEAEHYRENRNMIIAKEKLNMILTGSPA